jgi:hypothetical protein
MAIKCEAVILQSKVSEYRLKMKFENGSGITLCAMVIDRQIIDIGPLASEQDRWIRINEIVRKRIIQAGREAMKQTLN